MRPRNPSENAPSDPASSSGGPSIHRFSFWKPEPVPPNDATILPVKLHSLGQLETVTEKLFDVPRMTEMPPLPWEVEVSPHTTLLKWQVEEGVILKVRTEAGPPKPGEVLTIGAASAAPRRVFYRLYVQLFEQFGVTLLDERSRDFLTPRAFRAKLAS